MNKMPTSSIIRKQTSIINHNEEHINSQNQLGSTVI